MEIQNLKTSIGSARDYFASSESASLTRQDWLEIQDLGNSIRRCARSRSMSRFQLLVSKYTGDGIILDVVDSVVGVFVSFGFDGKFLRYWFSRQDNSKND